MKIVTAMVGIIAFAFSLETEAQVSSNELAVCAAIDGDLERLECFDQVSISHNLKGPEQVQTNIEGHGKWAVTENVNPIDDSKTVILRLRADSGQSRFREPISLIARCQSNSTDLYIVWNDYLGSEASVLTRIGSKNAETSRWSLSTDSQATFRRNPIDFLKDLLEADRLVAQVTPYNGSPVTAIFDTSGLQNAIVPLRQTCGW